MIPRFSAWVSGVLSALVVVAVALVLWSPGIRLPRLWQVQQDHGSTTLLTEMRDLGQLETLVYVHRTVFPHDLIPSRETRASGYGEDVTARTPGELQSLQAISLAEQLGLLHPTNHRRDAFVVVTTQIHLGYNLDDLIELARSHQEQHGSADALPLHLPDPVVLRVITEDINPEHYPYPPIPLDADGWRQVAMFTEQAVLRDPGFYQVRQRAYTAGGELISTLMPGVFTTP